MAAAVPVESGPAASPARAWRSALVVEWRDVGGLGRLAMVGLLLSGGVAVGLGLWIQASVHRHLLDVRTEALQRIVDDLSSEGLLPLGPGANVTTGTIDDAVEHRLIGGEIVGVAIHDAAGATVYGDPRGKPVPAGVGLPHVEQHADGLLHLVLPVEAADGRRVGTFEVLQQASSFDEVLHRVRRNLWLSISTGLATLGVAMGALTVAHARVLDRRHRHAERLLRDLLRVEDRQRRGIVGTLHDDIGQPLYRILYGLEGCRARVGHDAEVATELARLCALVRDVDRTLRQELHRLHGSAFDTLDLAAALDALADACRNECDLDVHVSIDLQGEPPPLARSVVVRAVQEALVNTRKHAAATSVAIRAQGDARRVSVEVVDNGRGTASPRGLGLTTAAERLEAIGGGLSIRPGTSGGTRVEVWAPTTGR